MHGQAAISFFGRELKSILLVMLLALGLRCAGITFDSLWLDEGYQTMADSHGQTLPDFLALPAAPYVFHFDAPRDSAAAMAVFRTVDPLCPPLYFLLLNRWMSWLGHSDLAVRSLSALFSSLSVGALYLFGRIFISPRAALLAAIFQAVSPYDIHYGQEARMYALEMLASTLSCGSLFWLLCRRPGAFIAGPVYCLSTWALINSHYTGLFVLLFQGCSSLWICARRRDAKLFLRLCLCWAGVLLLWLPWFEIFRHAAANRTASFYVARAPSLLWPFTALFLRVPVNWLSFICGNHVAPYAIPLYFSAAIFLFLAAFGNFLPSLSMGGFKLQRLAPGKRAVLAYLWCWALLPAIFIWLVDLIENHKVVEISRYTIGTAPAIYMLCGLGAAAVFNCGLLPKLLVLLHIILALLNNAAAHMIPQREPWRQMAASVEALCAPDDLLLVAQYYDIVCLDRYLKRPLLQVGIGSNYPPDRVEKLLNGRRRFWLLTAQEGESAKGIMPARFSVRKQVDLPHGLHLRLYEAAAPDMVRPAGQSSDP